MPLFLAELKREEDVDLSNCGEVPYTSASRMGRCARR
jgi:hypothetical protein